MNALSLLASVAQALAQCRLEAILIGNAAAALHGAPVTTLDIDFMFRSTPANLAKLKQFARQLDGVIFRPYYPASALYRVVNDERGLQVDFMAKIHGVRSFAGLRGRSEQTSIGGYPLLIADLNDIIAASAPRIDRAIMPLFWCWTRRCVKKKNSRAGTLRALKRESQRNLTEQIRRLLALPMEKRTNFLRVRSPGGGSHL